MSECTVHGMVGEGCPECHSADLSALRARLAEVDRERGLFRASFVNERSVREAAESRVAEILKIIEAREDETGLAAEKYPTDMNIAAWQASTAIGHRASGPRRAGPGEGGSVKKRLPFLPPPPRDFVTWQTKAFIVCVPTKMTEAEWREFLKYLKHIVRPCVQKEAP